MPALDTQLPRCHELHNRLHPDGGDRFSIEHVAGPHCPPAFGRASRRRKGLGADSLATATDLVPGAIQSHILAKTAALRRPLRRP